MWFVLVFVTTRKTRIQTIICEKRLLSQECCFHVVRDEPQPRCPRLHRKRLYLRAFILTYSNKWQKSNFNTDKAENKSCNDRDLTAASLGKLMDITHNAPCPPHLALSSTLITHSISHPHFVLSHFWFPCCLYSHQTSASEQRWRSLEPISASSFEQL